MDEQNFVIVNAAGDRYAPIETETAGTLQPEEATAGYMTTKNPALAAELRERYPWMSVYEHDSPIIRGNKPRRTVTWTVPEMPWKRNVPNGTRAEDAGGQSQNLETQTGRLEPAEVTEHAIQIEETARVDVCQETCAGEEMDKGDTEGQEIAPAGEEAKEK